MEALDNLIDSFAGLPGIGKKTAARLAYYVLKTNREYAEKLAEDIVAVKDRILSCSICGSYTETDPCPVCSSPNRDPVICVVEQSQDVFMIDSTGEYKGQFHVLGGVLSPINGIGPEELGLGRLVHRVKEQGIQEVIIATNPTMEGDTTALYIVKLLKELPVKVTRIASGMPVGGDMEYVDKLTLARSLRGRVDFS